MVLGRLEPESFAALVASEQPVCRGNRGGLPRTNEAPLPPLRMDWATQPDPFRCYEGASLVRLPRWGKHFHTGSSTSPTAWSQPLSIYSVSVLPLRPLADRVETVPRNDVVYSG